MAKASIVEVKPIKPEEKVVLELSVKEAALLYHVVGHIGVREEIGNVLGGIYDELNNIPRVQKYGKEIGRYLVRDTDKWNAVITATTLPNEK
jgi:hypothetical protein